MPWPSSKPDDLLARLVRLADGDTELVNNAIRAVKVDDKPAELDKIVEYIVRHRQRGRRREKVA